MTFIYIEICLYKQTASDMCAYFLLEPSSMKPDFNTSVMVVSVKKKNLEKPQRYALHATSQIPSLIYSKTRIKQRSH